MGAVRSVGVSLRNPSPYLRELERKTTENPERLTTQGESSVASGEYLRLTKSQIKNYDILKNLGQ